tara:strand:- start:56007 stop:57206 length:1200 start_codon:yes stop_codon:yes gene_type:complete
MTVLERVRWQDALDVAILTVIAFRAFQLLRGTVALQVLGGMGALVVAAIAASEAELVLTAYVLQALGAVAALASVVIFQGEIRRALRRVDPTQWWPRRRRAVSEAESATHKILANSLIKLAERRIGALIVLPRHDSLVEHLTGGTIIDALPSMELFESTFHVKAPVHDGAAVLSGERVHRVGVFLPISTATSIPEHFGTRHRAAFGLSELSDALVLIVSEERGEICLVSGGVLTVAPHEPEELALFIGERVAAQHTEAVSPKARKGEGRPQKPARRHLGNALALLVIFLMVSGAWYAVAGDRSTMISVQRSVELRGAPQDSEIDLVEPNAGEVSVTVRGPRRLLYSKAQSEVLLWIDLDQAKRGRNRLRIQSQSPGGLEIVNVEPDYAIVRLRPKPHGQ